MPDGNAPSTPPRTLHLEPALDLPLLARWLPDLGARSVALVRANGTPGHSGSTASAHGGRLDHIDESRGYSRAVAVWRHLRELIAAGQGERVALLWTGWVLAQPAKGIARGNRCEAVAREYRNRCEAVALGAAPALARAEWRRVSKERGGLEVVPMERVVRTGRRVPTGDAAPDGSPVLEDEVRRIKVTMTFVSGVQGPSFAAQAEAWGRERLAPLWAPGAVPAALARAAATGFAPPAWRATYERAAMRMRDSLVVAWAESAMA